MKLGDWINDRHLGDLAANFLSPERKRAIGPEAYVIRQAPKSDRSRPTPDCWTAIRRRWPWSATALCSPISDFPSGCRTNRPACLAEWNPGDIGPWATLLPVP